jgi:hypothetical protein
MCKGLQQGINSDNIDRMCVHSNTHTKFTTDQLPLTSPAKESEHGKSLQYSHVYINEIYFYLHISPGAGTAQSVQQWAMGWMARVRFLVWARDSSPLHSAQTGPGAHPGSYPTYWGPFLQGKAAEVRS